MFRFLFLFKDFFNRYSNKWRKELYLSSSTLLITRLDILESVTKSIGTSTKLRREAEANTRLSGQPIDHEIIQLTGAKVRALQLAYNDFSELALKERNETTNQTFINSYSQEADNMYS